MVVFDTNVINELREFEKEFYLDIDNYVFLEKLADQFSQTSCSFELAPERSSYGKTSF